MKQKQPKFSGILVVAVLMVLVLFIVSLSPLLAASGSKDTTCLLYTSDAADE